VAHKIKSAFPYESNALSAEDTLKMHGGKGQKGRRAESLSTHSWALNMKAKRSTPRNKTFRKPAQDVHWGEQEGQKVLPTDGRTNDNDCSRRRSHLAPAPSAA